MLDDQVWIIVLAAGKSKRMGSPKMLLPIAGESMICHVTKKALACEAAGVAVVYGGIEGEENGVKNELTHLPARLLFNPNADAGMSSSLYLGIKYVTSQQARAVVILLGDQPDVEPMVIRQVIQAYRQTKHPLVQAQYMDGPSHPVLFDSTLFAELLDISGDQGARAILQRYRSNIQWVPVAGKGPPDIDTPEEYARYLKLITPK